MADAHIAALHSSIERLRELPASLSEAELKDQAYPSEWTIADVLSHIGSGAVIFRRRLEDGIAGKETPEDFAPSVWDEWNAKSPEQQRDDALAADAALIDALSSVTTSQREAFSVPFGPLTLDFQTFVALRLNEHAFHTWDIEVIGDEAAGLHPQAAELVVDNLELIAKWAAKPTGDTRTLTVATTNPERWFSIALTPDAVTFSPTSPSKSADVRLPAEAFARLVYGRLDAAHTPADVEGADLELLRRVFPGL